jgi:nucleotide-binding universal stress UspA family protein
LEANAHRAKEQMLDRALVGVDGEIGGRDAIALARSLLCDGGKLTLVHVHGYMPSRCAPLLASVDLAECSQRLLERECETIGTDAELLSFVASSPGRGLHVLAERRDADLIVVGSSARGRLGRIALGDDTREALNGAPCTVAIARRGYVDQPVPILNIGVGYDGSPEAEAALAAARAIAQHQRVLIHAVDAVSLPSLALAGPGGESVGKLIETIVEEAGERLDAIPDIEGEAVYGVAEEELTRLSEDVNLLVVGSRGYGPARRMMFGSVSNYLQRHARCSLLVVPRTAVAAMPARSGQAPQPHADRVER